MTVLSEVASKSCQHSQFIILNILQQHKKVLVSDKKYSDERVDVLSCLLIAERIMTGSVTDKRIKVARIVFSLSGGKFGMKEDDIRQILSQLDIMEKMFNIKETVSEACNTSFLFPILTPHKDIISVMFKGKL